MAYLKNAKIRVQVDIGFGDVVTPAAELREFPTLLDLPRPRILVYPPETVVAEKLQAMVALGPVNSRMKDFYDLRFMSQVWALALRDQQVVRFQFSVERSDSLKPSLPSLPSPAFPE